MTTRAACLVMASQQRFVVERVNGLRWDRTPRSAHEADEDLDDLNGGRPRIY